MQTFVLSQKMQVDSQEGLWATKEVFLSMRSLLNPLIHSLLILLIVSSFSACNSTATVANPSPSPTPSPNPTPTPTPPPAGTPPYTIPAPATGGKTYWVAQSANASDSNPGTQDKPWKTIQKAATTLQAGDVVVIRAGVYRETVAPVRGGSSASNRVTYVAYPGEEVVVSGADVYTNWTQEGNLWWISWNTSLPDEYPSGPDTTYRFAARREQVIQDGVPLKQVQNKESLIAGSFWVQGSDSAPSRIYIRTQQDDAPSKHTLEVATRSKLFDSYVNIGSLRLMGLRFRYANNKIQDPAVELSGKNSLFEYLTVEMVNSVGFSINGESNTYRNNLAQDNGQMGWSGYECNNCVVEDSKSLRNNTKGYDANWESGGGKFVRFNGTIFRRYQASNNNGPGLWFDGYNTNNRVEDSFFENNLITGIQIEYSSTTNIIRNNVIQKTRWYQPARSGDGIRVVASWQNQIMHNTVTDCGGTGIHIVFDKRFSSPSNQIINNVLANNQEAVALHFYDVSGSDPQTNKFNGNLYWRGNGTALFSFEANGGFYRGDDLAQWKSYTGGDSASKLGNPLLQSDGWHISDGSAALKMGITPPTAVPTDREGDLRPTVAADAGADQKN